MRPKTVRLPRIVSKQLSRKIRPLVEGWKSSNAAIKKDGISVFVLVRQCRMGMANYRIEHRIGHRCPLKLNLALILSLTLIQTLTIFTLSTY